MSFLLPGCSTICCHRLLTASLYIAIHIYISIASGALVKFDIRDNDIRAEGGKALAEALKNNQVMTELNISNNMLSRNTEYNADLSGVIAIRDAIPTMRAVATVTINMFPLPIQDIKTKAELDFSGKRLQVENAVVIAALIPLNVSQTCRLLPLLSKVLFILPRGRW